MKNGRKVFGIVIFAMFAGFYFSGCTLGIIGALFNDKDDDKPKNGVIAVEIGQSEGHPFVTGRSLHPIRREYSSTVLDSDLTYQWNKDDYAITGADEFFYTPTTAGSYTLTFGETRFNTICTSSPVNVIDAD